VDPLTLTPHYETARALAVGDAVAGLPVVGLTVLYRWGLPAWIKLMQTAPQRLDAPAAVGTSPRTDTAATILVLASMLLAFSMESSQCTPKPS
jgi:hypothetical protein